MSGFFGMLRLDGEPIDESFLEAIAGKMHFRGPHGRSVWKHNNLGGCFTLMRTGPAPQAARQPVNWRDLWLWGDMRLVHEHAGKALRELFLSFDEIRFGRLVWVALDREEARQTLFLEEFCVESKRRRHASQWSTKAFFASPQVQQLGARLLGVGPAAAFHRYAPRSARNPEKVGTRYSWTYLPRPSGRVARK